MKTLLAAALAAFSLIGCQSATPRTAAVAADAPHEIDQLTTETLVYDCPKCGMEFDRAGVCTMDGATLVETHVAYVCPADGKPVEHAGRCPRCEVSARIVRTAALSPAPADPGSPATTPEAASGGQ